MKQHRYFNPYSMKNILLSSLILLTAVACQAPCPEVDEDSKREIDRLKIKLEATEAQLINVSAELSKMKSKQDTIEDRNNMP